MSSNNAFYGYNSIGEKIQLLDMLALFNPNVSPIDRVQHAYFDNQTNGSVQDRDRFNTLQSSINNDLQIGGDIKKFQN